MHRNSISLKQIAQSADQLDLAFVQVKCDSKLSVAFANASFYEIAEKYNLSLTNFFSWIKSDEYKTIDSLTSTIIKDKNLEGESIILDQEDQILSLKWSLSLQKNNQLICFIKNTNKIKEQKSLFKHLFNNYNSSIVITNKKNKITMTNSYFENISGYSKIEALGKDPSDFGSGRQSELFYQELWHSLQNEGHWSGVIWNKHKDGREYPEHKTISKVFNEQGIFTHYFSIGNILLTTEDQPTPKNLCHGLISPEVLVNTLNESLWKYPKPIAVFHIGVDHMLQVKQLYGIAFSDHIITILLKELKDTFLPRGMICWSTGNEIIVAANHINTPDMAHAVGEIFLKKLKTEAQFDEIEWTMTASLGVSFCTQANDAWEAIEQSHIAMHHAKEMGGNNLQFYDIQTQNLAQRNLQIEKALRLSIQNQEFLLHYQPIIDLQTKKIYGAEALIRWNSALFGTIPPDQFIPIAEQNGIIKDIGLWVFQTVCCQLSLWKGKFTGSIAVNLSVNQIQDKELPNKLLSILLKYKIPVERVHLEITETAMINDINSAASILSTLQSRGFSLSIDDFGTGYSSLSYLTRLPVNKLKVDRSFIDTMNVNKDSLVVTKAIIGLAKGLGLSVVAEGVESSDQINTLIDLDCDFAQGYLISKPLSKEEFIEYYREYEENIKNNSPCTA